MKKRVFISSSAEALDTAYVIQENLERDFECTVWTQGIFKPFEYTLESLEETLDNFDYGVFIFSPDDKLTSRDEDYDTIRDNVLFEFGLFAGRLGRENVFFILPRGNSVVHIPSDLVGVTPISYDADRADKNWNAALGPACNKITKEIKSRERSILQIARKQYDIVNNKFPHRRSIRYLDIACVFNTRTSFDNCIGVHQIFSQAEEIKAIGISLNSIIMNWETGNLVRLIQKSNCKISLLLLNPDGVYTKMREKDESLIEGTIAQVTRTNINLLKKARLELKGKAENLSYRLYDKMPFVNMYIINNAIIVLQHYMPNLRGQESPVYVIRNEGNEAGLFKSYNTLFEKNWEEANVLNE